MTTQTSAQTGDQPVSERASEVKDRAADVGGTAQEKAGEVASTATSRAGDVASTATGRAGDVASTAKEQALDVAQEAQRQARDLIGEFRGQVQQQTQQQRERLAQLLREFEDELNQMVQAGGGTGTATEVVRQVADRLSGVRTYLEGSGNPVDDVRRFARRRPGTFLLLAAAAGVLAGRATRGAAAARKQQQSSGKHVIDVRDGYTPSSYASGYSSGTSAGYAAGTTGLGAGVTSTTGTDYGTGGYGTSTYGGSTYSETTSGYRDQYGEGGTATGDPLSGVERTSDPNLAPSSGTLTGDDTALGMPDSPAAPEYGGEGVGMPGPNAPTGDAGYDTGYDTETGYETDRPTYGGSGSAEGSR